MIFTHPRCLQCFSTQENLTTKTLNPKVSSFAVPSFSLLNLTLKICKEHLNSTQTLSKLCHVLPNRDMVGVYDPRYDQHYPQNMHIKPKIVSRFLKIVSRLDTLQNMLTACQNRDTLHKSCHDSSLCQIPFLSHIATLIDSLIETE